MHRDPVQILRPSLGPRGMTTWKEADNFGRLGTFDNFPRPLTTSRGYRFPGGVMENSSEMNFPGGDNLQGGERWEPHPRRGPRESNGSVGTVETRGRGALAAVPLVDGEEDRGRPPAADTNGSQPLRRQKPSLFRCLPTNRPQHTRLGAEIR